MRRNELLAAKLAVASVSNGHIAESRLPTRDAEYFGGEGGIDSGLGRPSPFRRPSGVQNRRWRSCRTHGLRVGGEGEIRTREWFPIAGFQVWRLAR